MITKVRLPCHVHVLAPFCPMQYQSLFLYWMELPPLKTFVALEILLDDSVVDPYDFC